MIARRVLLLALLLPSLVLALRTPRPAAARRDAPAASTRRALLAGAAAAALLEVAPARADGNVTVIPSTLATREDLEALDRDRQAMPPPEAQTVELIGDAAVGKARVATLKGSYSAADGLVRTKQRGLVGRLFRRSKYDFAPSIEEAYDELEFDGAIETGFRWFRRTWVCTFLGERVRVCREAGGGLAVYDRMEEGEALREIERISNEPFGFEAMARQMLEQMQRGGMGGMGGPGGPGGGGFPPGLMDGDFRGRGDFDGPSQRSSIP